MGLANVRAGTLILKRAALLFYARITACYLSLVELRHMFMLSRGEAGPHSYQDYHMFMHYQGEAGRHFVPGLPHVAAHSRRPRSLRSCTSLVAVDSRTRIAACFCFLRFAPCRGPLNRTRMTTCFSPLLAGTWCRPTSGHSSLPGTFTRTRILGR